MAKNQDNARQAQFFGALAHPARLDILDILAEGEACVCHLSTALQQRQAYISQQLALLKEAGLIGDRKDGLYVYYHLADPSIVQLLQETRRTLAGLTGDESRLHMRRPPLAEGECPCPKCQAARTAQPNTSGPTASV